MKILKIRAEMFRNYQRLELVPHPEMNIITGKNAQGKTNLLEAIYFNLNGYSFRATSDKDLIYWQQDFCNVVSLLENQHQQWKQSVAINSNGQKKFLINNVAKKRKDLGHSGVVLFTPDDLALIKSSPQVRRKFIDQEIGPFQAGYSHYYHQYNKALTHRNHLLKSIRVGKESPSMLELWDQQLVENGVNLLLGRLAVLKKLAPYVIKWYRAMGKENLEIRYLSSLKIDPPVDESQLRFKFNRLLKEMRSQEISRCQTMIGPHRDDIVFLINGQDARDFGSQGQQRTIVLSLKMALVSLWADENHDKPILLLDDVLFELDKHRQEMLLSKIEEGVQTFITTSHFPEETILHNRYQLYTVTNGVIN